MKQPNRRIVYIEGTGNEGNVLDCRGEAIGTYRVLRTLWRFSNDSGLYRWCQYRVELVDGSIGVGSHNRDKYEALRITLTEEN